MPVMQCPNGHVTTDEDTVRCRQCGDFVRQRVDPAPRDGTGGWDADTPVSLVGWGLVFVAIGVLAVVTLDPGLGLLVGGPMVAGGGTAWLVGCIALGVRLGDRT